MHQLTKHEKKIARILNDKRIDSQYKTALEQVDQILSAWKQGSVDNRTACMKLYKKVEQQDNRIGKRYNDIGGSDYLLAVADIYIDGQITEEDIKDFTEETRTILNWLKSNAEK